MMAMMLVASATAFAGDSDALKAILKAKDFKEAQSLISSSLAQLTDASEKAKAYNKLVDLAYEKYKKEDDVKTTNMVMHKEDPVDTDGTTSSPTKRVRWLSSSARRTRIAQRLSV